MFQTAAGVKTGRSNRPIGHFDPLWKNPLLIGDGLFVENTKLFCQDKKSFALNYNASGKTCYGYRKNN